MLNSSAFQHLEEFYGSDDEEEEVPSYGAMGPGGPPRYPMGKSITTPWGGAGSTSYSMTSNGGAFVDLGAYNGFEEEESDDMPELLPQQPKRYVKHTTTTTTSSKSQPQRSVPVTRHTQSAARKIRSNQTGRAQVHPRNPKNQRRVDWGTRDKIRDMTAESYRDEQDSSPDRPNGDFTQYSYDFTNNGANDSDFVEGGHFRQSTSSGLHNGFDEVGGAEQKPKKKDGKFLRELQQELEQQRVTWKDDVLQMLNDVDLSDGATAGSGDSNSHTSAASSHVDTSSGHPVLKAVFDVKKYNQRNIDVSVDKLTNKVTVHAKANVGNGTMSRSFTQKVQLPQYSDHNRMRYRFDREGLLHVEVPLIYYFAPEKKKAKSFVYKVGTNKAGQKQLEILVNIGSGFRAWNIHVRVLEDNKMIIVGEKDGVTKSGQTKTQRKLIKQYTLPKNADLDGITSQLGDDGRLEVYVPLQKRHPLTLS